MDVNKACISALAYFIAIYNQWYAPLNIAYHGW